LWSVKLVEELFQLYRYGQLNWQRKYFSYIV